ncbi:MAG TPA: VOC family protein [Candidatus Acidoferrales bacterium]|nr:VOC family protein [Candidatus Acidoferrales bacterium]
MHELIPRRTFLSAAGAAAASLFAPLALFGKEMQTVPATLDHILLGASDLDAGIGLVFQRTGVRPAFGGVHPGRGTRNALLGLGPLHYLEIIAPDPQQPSVPDFLGLRSLAAPRLITWAVHPGDIHEQARRLTAAALAFDGPDAGSRNRPDGRVLHWSTLRLKDDRLGLLPFFIEWGAGSVHPSADAPQGCRLVHFEVAGPDPAELAATFRRLDIDVQVAKADRPQLRATIAGPRGEFHLTS